MEHLYRLCCEILLQCILNRLKVWFDVSKVRRPRNISFRKEQIRNNGIDYSSERYWIPMVRHHQKEYPHNNIIPEFRIVYFRETHPPTCKLSYEIIFWKVLDFGIPVRPFTELALKTCWKKHWMFRNIEKYQESHPWFVWSNVYLYGQIRICLYKMMICMVKFVNFVICMVKMEFVRTDLLILYKNNKFDYTNL